ncbi:MAG: MATE family efflux pump [Pseudolabrys sp.]|jgi:MATE family multidrug resistance protein|nr:MATE family efflux pump [Pseudolabrys sp.]
MRTLESCSDAGRGGWRGETVDTIRLALPIALTQLGQVAMMTSDLALVGRLGDKAVAAAALAQVVLFVCFVLGMGLVSAVAPLAAQAYGAREPRLVRRALRVGLWVAAFLGIPLTAFVLQGEGLLLWLGQSPDIARLAGDYLAGLAWSLVPGWWFVAIRSFMGAVNRPEPALWVTLIAVPLNTLLAYVLIFGAFGFPELGMTGAGVATALVNLGMCAACVVIAYTQPPFRKYRVLGRFWRADWPLLRQLIVIGAPMSGSFLLEYGLFGSAAVFVGWIGAMELAAHQIALQIAAIVFMVPFGISMAATVRVGHAVGRGESAAVRRAGLAAIGLGATFMAAMVVLILLLRHDIPLLFLSMTDGAAVETANLAASLLTIGATFFIADGVQTVAAGALRGLNDTRIPMLFAALSFWTIGMAACYGLAFPAGLGVTGIWIGFTVSLIVYASLLIWRFDLLSRRGFMPEVAHAPA